MSRHTHLATLTALALIAALPAMTNATIESEVTGANGRELTVLAKGERLTIPGIRPACPLHDILVAWPANRPLFAALERADAPLLAPTPRPAGLLIGPEGGFGPRDLTLLDRCRFVHPKFATSSRSTLIRGSRETRRCTTDRL